MADELRHVETIRDKVGKYRFAMEPPILKKPHHVAKEHPMIAALQAIYREETLLEPELLTTGGGTYASFLDNGVAFGALFPGKENVAHQTDEYIEIDELLQATVIYARAIYELANLDF
ncbi:M20/M25/M40 family metallo-hydrolase [Paenibacillus ehimensis]|uniref:M20/M25/M40 family metallo-hydrolase n=1 Tax=Paenibacillus ehimensis TaxID=79264 RepID=UPI0034E249B0